jgi:hypothetical protein
MDDIDWLIYADYLDDQNINHFIREDLQYIEEIIWDYEYSKDGVGACYPFVINIGPVNSPNSRHVGAEDHDYFVSIASYGGVGGCGNDNYCNEGVGA